MSTTDVAEESKKTETGGYLATWKEYPFEIKVMDLATLGWLAVGIVNIILFMLNLEFTDVTIRSFSSFFLPVFMVIVTYSLRLRLLEKPALVKNTFIIWAVLFGLMVIMSILVLIFYPPLY